MISIGKCIISGLSRLHRAEWANWLLPAVLCAGLVSAARADDKLDEQLTTTLANSGFRGVLSRRSNSASAAQLIMILPNWAVCSGSTRSQDCTVTIPVAVATRPPTVLATHSQLPLAFRAITSSARIALVRATSVARRW